MSYSDTEAAEVRAGLLNERAAAAEAVAAHASAAAAGLRGERAGLDATIAELRWEGDRLSGQLAAEQGGHAACRQQLQVRVLAGVLGRHRCPLAVPEVGQVDHTSWHWQPGPTAAAL